MNKLPCEVVKDLLPSYVDELTSGTTNELVKEHLKDCEDCRNAYAAMIGPEAAAREEQERKEIDYLRKNKKRNRRIAIWSVVGALVLALGVLCIRTFLVGEKSSNWAPMDLRVEGNKLTFEAVPMDSASAIKTLT